MTDEEINIKIAEALGRVRRPDGFWYPPGKTIGTAGIPNYCKSLDAMHEAEKMTFTIGENWAAYFDALEQACGFECDPITATARQRAEAFLRTLDLWTE